MYIYSQVNEIKYIRFFLVKKIHRNKQKAKNKQTNKKEERRKAEK